MNSRFETGISHGNPDRITKKKKNEHSIYIHGAPDGIVFPNKRSNVYLLINKIGLILNFTSP